MSIKTFIQKHSLLVGLGAGLVGVGGAVAGAEYFDNHFENRQELTQVQAATIKQEDIPEIIAKHTGLSDLVIQSIDLEESYYEVEASNAQASYEFNIHSQSGQVTQTSKETINQASNLTGNQSGSLLDQEAIKKLVAEKTGQDKLTYAQIQTETNDGRTIYDVKASSDTKSYELELDAQSGDILSYQESELATALSGQGATQSSNQANLKTEEVKAIVEKTLGQKNLTYSQIQLTQDPEDYSGQAYYEVTALSNGVEYELDIHAQSGQVLQSSTDKN